MLVRQFGTDFEVHAPAKLNLFLEVLFKRDDGFHELETLMAPISICDTIYFSTTSDQQLQFSCRWAAGIAARFGRGSAASADLGDLPQGADNIVVTAVERLRRRAGVSSGASIRLVKRIPSASGLGGASSDAAAALVAADRAWRLGWTLDQLALLAAEIGSDVPFFLRGGAAICRGRGERIESLSRMPRLHLVVVRPPEGLSTPEVYRRCEVPSRPRSVAPLADALRTGDRTALGRGLMNRLQEPASRMSSWIRRLSETFSRSDCLGHQMSGSGSAYFGVCRNSHHARRLANRLNASGIGFARHATTVATRPPHAASLS